ncbi:MAG: response regulator [Ardenticatenaceae bacterium]|nr:response regulator [Ardenticatenaceae bacterium]
MDKKKILIIDDEFPVRYLVEHQLRRKGFEVQAAKDGPTGLETAHEFQPDLIVLDVMMPEVDGFEVCEKIRRDPQLARTPVIFLTALMTKKHKLQAFEAGADDYLVKPFQPDELLAHISAILRRMEPQPVSDTAVDEPSVPEEAEEPPTPVRGRVLVFYGPKGGVGTTTLAIQMSEALAMQEDRSVVLLDLALPMGGIAPALSLYTHDNMVGLLNHWPENADMAHIQPFMQRHRTNLFVIPAPDTVITTEEMPDGDNLEPLLDMLVEAGYFVVVDAGAKLDDLSLTAMQLADLNYIVTSGEEVANKLTNAYLGAANRLGLNVARLLPVVNELYGTVEESEVLVCPPVATIARANERLRARLWVKEPGLRTLMEMALTPKSS